MATQANLDYVQKMFVAYLGRAASASAQEYYADLIDADADLGKAQLFDDLYNSAEAQALYSGMTNDQIIEQIFQNCFNRDPAFAGLTYYYDEIAAGTFNILEAAAVIANDAAPADAAILDAKQEAADKITTEMGSDAAAVAAYAANAADARASLNKVTDSASAAAYDGAAELAAISAGQQIGSTVALTKGGSFTGTSGNDAFTGTETTLTGTTVLDAYTDDNDTLTVTNTDGTVDFGVATQIAGVENVVVNETSFGTLTVDAEEINTGTLTLNQLQAGANGNATVNGKVGSITIAGGDGITGTLTVNAITAGSAVTVNAGSAATVTTSTAGAAGKMTIVGGALTGTATAIADTIDITLSKAAATANIDGVGAAAAASVTFGSSVSVVNGAATAVKTLDLSSTFAATATATATATLTTAAATSYSFSGSNDIVLQGDEAFFDGKVLTDNSTGTTTLKITTLDDTDLSKAGVDKFNLAAANAGAKTASFNNNADVTLSTDVTANAGFTIDADDDGATSYLKGTLNLTLGADISGNALTIDGSGATDDGFDNINLTVSTAQTGLALVTGTGVVTATGSKALVLAATSTAKSLDASAMTGAVTVTFDNTNDIATVKTGSGADTITNATAAIAAGTKANINTGGGKDTITMLSAATATIDGGTEYDTIKVTGDISGLTISNVEEMATQGNITSAKASQMNGATYIMSGANTFTFGTAAANFDSNSIDLTKLTINNLTSFTVDASNGLSTTLFTTKDAITVQGSSITDTIKGTANGDTLHGNGGADTITGNAGGDTIDGGAGGDVLLGDNNGTVEVQTLTITTAAAGASTITILGKAVSFTDTGAAGTTGDAAATAINADADIKDRVSASSDGAGVVTLTFKVDGDVAEATSTVQAGGTYTHATTTAGVESTSNAIDTFTGGTGSDTFILGPNESGAAPSGTVMDVITDFGVVTGNKDVIAFAGGALSIVTNATATAGTAKITSAGIATFNAADDTLAEKIVATEAGINAGGAAAAGQMAIFQHEGDAYLFISDGTDGVGANDTLVKLVGIDTTAAASDTVTIANGTATLG